MGILVVKRRLVEDGDENQRGRRGWATSVLVLRFDVIGNHGNGILRTISTPLRNQLRIPPTPLPLRHDRSFPLGERVAWHFLLSELAFMHVPLSPSPLTSPINFLLRSCTQRPQLSYSYTSTAINTTAARNTILQLVPGFKKTLVCAYNGQIKTVEGSTGLCALGANHCF